MPLQATSGAASYDAFGGGVAVVPTYIEEVFSTWLYTGTDTNPNTITNGIDLSTKGGLVWCKGRGAGNHSAWDTARGVKNLLIPNLTNENLNIPVTYPAFPTYGLQSFNTTGFTLGKNWEGENIASGSMVSWTFRKQPKFFDVVTYTGTGSNRTIAHSLGSVPACIMVKRTDTTGDWQVYHRSLANTEYLVLNSTAAKATGATRWNSTTPTSSVFSLGTDATVNASAGTYVAYIFAHDAGGFGLTGTDNVISCGSYTGVTYPNSLEVTLGYEPQFVIIKNSNTTSDWTMWDIMRGMAVIPAANDAQAQILNPNTSAAESIQPGIFPTATGFVVKNGLTSISSPSDKMIYIAIRRGPMKVPTTGTSVFSPNYQTASTGTAITTNFPPDLQLYRSTAQVTNEGVAVDRLRGVNTTTTANSTPWLDTTTTAAEASASSVTRSWGNTGFQMPGFVATIPSVFYSYRRAPSFMDVVCYTGNNVSGRTITHNLAAVPQLMIVKSRTSATRDWIVYDATNGATKYMNLNNNSASGAGSFWVSTAPTSTVFTVSDSASVNDPAQNYVAYLFATCAGVSKVFSYTGNGSSQTINCGFTAGARFVLIKRTDSTGDWYVWDTARGIVAGNDPHLSLNTTAAEVTTDDTIDTDSTGFVVNQVSATNVNVSSATYIGLAVA